MSYRKCNRNYFDGKDLMWHIRSRRTLSLSKSLRYASRFSTSVASTVKPSWPPCAGWISLWGKTGSIFGNGGKERDSLNMPSSWTVMPTTFRRFLGVIEMDPPGICRLLEWILMYAFSQGKSVQEAPVMSGGYFFKEELQSVLKEVP